MLLELTDIETILRERGGLAYEGEGVTQLEHALQTATLAEAAGAEDTLVTAALLHDLGHLLLDMGDTPTVRGIDDRHQHVVVPILRGLFPPSVYEPIRLHVEAKRALCCMDPDYVALLSPDSRRSLILQGGAFTADETIAFAALRHSTDALRLRRWDDQAKRPVRALKPLEHFLTRALRACVRDADTGSEVDEASFAS